MMTTFFESGELNLSTYYRTKTLKKAGLLLYGHAEGLDCDATVMLNWLVLVTQKSKKKKTNNQE